ncbi:uncharacterized protein PV09_02173 [Verruconis gallopava]|uniref:Ceramide glucosyltransferase n=1 Tax=Verruconis gallopava TaxID=253628 RepID=A0A0D2AKD9_9PEZI|nr:uncharacterized protein PV09_02173 [Verruconis gallopava]KIW07323.1 hypothetical protein PV09_02173 [Verruconis gallopava]
MAAEVVAAICLFWGSLVVLVSGIGYWQIQRHYSSAQPKSRYEDEDAPHVTIIRPAKGLDPQLYECLASTFRQTYPKDKLTIRFCVASHNDASMPVLERLAQDFSSFDVKVLVEEEDPLLQDGVPNALVLGPNPKIRSMSRAYREAKGDIVWIIDCNVWVASGVCGRMVDRLLGRTPGSRPQRLVHQMPLVVDIEGLDVASTSSVMTEGFHKRDLSILTKGGRLEEMFMSSAHGKFYTAINTVLIAPCLVGKSNMFRRSHLNALTNGEGIDYFSNNICEDHLIGDLLWKRPIPEEVLNKSPGKKWGKHAMLFGDIAIQPMKNMHVSEYIARRVRWLRVRKYTVPAATGVEPTTESFVCSGMLAYGATTLPYAHEKLGIPQTWPTFVLVWLLVVFSWAITDWTLYKKIHSAASIAQDEHTPLFARPANNGGARRPLNEWLLAWLGREALAFPIWLWAVFGGATVTWRGKQFWVGMDMRVHAIEKQARSKKDVMMDRTKVE